MAPYFSSSDLGFDYAGSRSNLGKEVCHKSPGGSSEV